MVPLAVEGEEEEPEKGDEKNEDKIVGKKSKRKLKIKTG